MKRTIWQNIDLKIEDWKDDYKEYGEEITRKKLNYYTRSLHPYIAEVYGW